MNWDTLKGNGNSLKSKNKSLNGNASPEAV